jgi:HAD superfamily hydrolase (TIGR01509 family)
MDYVYFEGVSNFIKDLRTNNIICAIVTSSNMNKIDSVRKKINNFEVFFDYIVTSEMFERSKPDPEPYLKAAQLANASSDECIVFEDSLNGIMSAKNAGMFTIGITTTNEVTKIKNLCDYTIDNYKELSFHKINFIINNLNI